MDAVTSSRGQHTILTYLPVPLLFLTAGLQAQTATEDLTKVSLETLMNTQVTSVSKKAEKLSRTAAAIFVITQQDIRRSGLTSVPELLRMVPGLSVARQDSNKWAITSRGFSGRFANKLLVLIDGRTVYSPVFSGVWWDTQDLILEDVERIEVIRGPGGTLWGANAVNGVINIITKRAQDTQGGLVAAGGGSEERAVGSTRYGGRLGAKSFYRVFGRYFNRDSSPGVDGKDGHDSWSALRGGFRVDSELSDRNSVTLQGDLSHGDDGEIATTSTATPPFRSTFAQRTGVSGGNLLSRWKHVYADGSDSALQIYYDNSAREDTLVTENVNTLDVDWQHHIPLAHRHDLIWGLGYRSDADRVRGDFGFFLSPERRVNQLFSAFVQDEIAVVPDRFRVTLGMKLEHNDYTGFETQPGVRALWSPNDRNAVWAAVSRAVHTPSRIDSDVRIAAAVFPGSGGLLDVLTLVGNPRIRSEDLIAYELGYRVQAAPRIFLDFATYYNNYSNLRGTTSLTPYRENTPLPAHLVLPLQFVNRGGGDTFGGESLLTWKVTGRWEVNAGYTLLRLRIPNDGGSSRESPNHQFQIRSNLKLTRHVDLETDLYHVGRLVYQGTPAYTRIDARLGWRVGESLELSLGLQNLLDARHWEFVSAQENLPTQSKRGAYAKLTWQF